MPRRLLPLPFCFVSPGRRGSRCRHSAAVPAHPLRCRYCATFARESRGGGIRPPLLRCGLPCAFSRFPSCCFVPRLCRVTQGRKVRKAKATSFVRRLRLSLPRNRARSVACVRLPISRMVALEREPLALGRIWRAARPDRAAPGSRMRAHPLLGLLRSLTNPFRWWLTPPQVCVSCGDRHQRVSHKSTLPLWCNAHCVDHSTKPFFGNMGVPEKWLRGRWMCGKHFWPTTVAASARSSLRLNIARTAFASMANAREKNCAAYGRKKKTGRVSSSPHKQRMLST